MGDDKVKNILTKTVSGFLAALSVCVISVLICLNAGGVKTMLSLTACVAAACVFTGVFSGFFTEKTRNIMLLAVSFAILFYKIFTSPYSPCHDAYDIHNVLSHMLHNGTMSEGIYIKTYMNVFVNNKFVVYIYLPFVYLFKNTELGVRFLNGALFLGTVFFAASASRTLLKKDKLGDLFFIMSILSPAVLLSGPYIYLPSLFISSLAIYCYVKKNRALKILFLICAAMLFVLRPTCLGFLLAFMFADMFLRFENKKKLLKSAAALVLVLIFSLTFKSSLGFIMYKTGLHPYPNILNAGGLWSAELGTRLRGEETGTCFYTMFEPEENGKKYDYKTDNIQNDFFSLWKYYRADVVSGTDNYSNIVRTQKKIKKELTDRFFARTPSEIWEHFYLKTINFYKDTYIPYYYKANLNDENMLLYKDYDKKYRAYFNMILLLFFICMVINFIRVLLNRDKSKGAVTAAGFSAFAVTVVFLILLEVQKKYMLDFFVPMVMCIAMTLTPDSHQKPRARAWAAGAVIIAAAFAFNETLYDIKIFKNAKTSLVRNGEECVFSVKMEKTCTEDYYIYAVQSDEKIYIYGKDEFSVTYPSKSDEIFILRHDSENVKRFSASVIKE